MIADFRLVIADFRLPPVRSIRNPQSAILQVRLHDLHHFREVDFELAQRLKRRHAVASPAATRIDRVDQALILILAVHA
jgi:hypothetical protein